MGDITIPGRYVNYAPIDEGKMCFGGIQDNITVGKVIFGDVAFKSTYVVFKNSGDSLRIGWAQKTLS